MKRLLRFSIIAPICITILCLFSLFIPITAHAQVIPQHQISSSTIHPHISGGGCSNTVYSGNNTRFVDYSACISAMNGFFSAPAVIPDAFITFGAISPGQWRACSITMYLYDSHENYILGSTQNCLSAARSGATNAHYAPSEYFGNGIYHEEVFVYYFYNADPYGYNGPRISSPTVSTT